MADIVDARGLLCPLPVMLLVKKMKEIQFGEFEILVDDLTAKENICRTAEGKSWKIKEIIQQDFYSKILVCRA